MDLFSTVNQLTPIPVEDGELAFLPQLPLALPNDEVLRLLLDETAWREEMITVWGKRHLQPRLSAWYGEARYTYSGKTFDPLPFTPLQLAIKAAAEEVTGRRYNSVLLNCYRNERDSMGFHSDNEPELGPEPSIASVSFGASRTFILKHKRLPRTVKLDLTDGSLLHMAGPLQANWRHGINKETRPCGLRVNLTLRHIY
ncbi:alpha-ketoglutarate-dependent dioxygenase AlkB family protein [Massilia endophytica]|uniref:alpha-ketoglutarate-dependent dioxygenase AlkB family protein n=1 Tax=Massilia endophytica TaxID=2899220 RepID=UPI001E62E614|nr:alpha-ketoglutarate-dependent dioxygenase AlkB [Massilia endophytica]UGQ46293.1 alpha-ketoglutarate-dependent dioxygenase AlkB [Massilia endophytica]